MLKPVSDSLSLQYKMEANPDASKEAKWEAANAKFEAKANHLFSQVNFHISYELTSFFRNMTPGF